jgi:hypothetical protein
MKSILENHNLPTWEETNTTENIIRNCNPNACSISATSRRDQNNKLAKNLKTNGWTFREGINIVEHGFTLSFSKPTGILNHSASRPYAHPYLTFEWYWDTYGDQEFWNGSMFTFYNYDQEKYSSPHCTIEITYIKERDLTNLYEYERRLVHALISQTPLFRRLCDYN